MAYCNTILSQLVKLALRPSTSSCLRFEPTITGPLARRGYHLQSQNQKIREMRYHSG